MSTSAPARWFAAHQSARAPTFLYQFGYIPEFLRGRRKAAAHGFEMLFVFEALARAPIPLPASDGDQREMSLVHRCWVGFVTRSVPDCAAWPAYDPKTDSLMLFGEDGSHTVTGFRKAAYDILVRIEEATLAKAKPR